MRRVGKPENPKILIVDDDPGVLDSLTDLLRKDYLVYASDQPLEAMSLLETEEFAVILTDQRMPECTGSQLLARAAHLNPRTARLLLTAYADIEAVVEAVNEGHIFYYFMKPWQTATLLKVLKDVSERWAESATRIRLLKELAELKSPGFPLDVYPESNENEQLRRDNQTLRNTLEQLRLSHWHLRKLGEVLPICVECGKVKTSESSWDEVVDFLKKNSDFLSHGYCPACYTAVKQRYFPSNEEE